MTMSFRDETSAFFDELSGIIDAQQADKEKGMDQQNDRPYSALLTQDEEPTQEYNPTQIEEPEPEVVTRGE